MFDESPPDDAHAAAAVARALDQLACVHDVDVIAPADDPTGRATVEVTPRPDYVHKDRLPGRIARTVYDPDAPWHCDIGIVEVRQRAPGLKTAILR